MSKKIHSIKIGNETYEFDIPNSGSGFEVINPVSNAYYDGIAYDPNSNKPVRNTCVEYESDDNGILKNFTGNMNVYLVKSREYEESDGTGTCEYDITSNPDKFSLELSASGDNHDKRSGIVITGPYYDSESDTSYVDDDLKVADKFTLYSRSWNGNSHIDIDPGQLDIQSSSVINIGKNSEIIEIGTGDTKYGNKASRIDIGATSSVNINCFDGNRTYIDEINSDINTTNIGSTLLNTVGLPAIYIKDEIFLNQNNGEYYIDVTNAKKYVFTGYPADIEHDTFDTGYLWIDAEYYSKFLTFIKRSGEFTMDYTNYWPILITSYPSVKYGPSNLEIYYHGIGVIEGSLTGKFWYGEYASNYNDPSSDIVNYENWCNNVVIGASEASSRAKVNIGNKSKEVLIGQKYGRNGNTNTFVGINTNTTPDNITNWVDIDRDGVVTRYYYCKRQPVSSYNYYLFVDNEYDAVTGFYEHDDATEYNLLVSYSDTFNILHTEWLDDPNGANIFGGFLDVVHYYGDDVLTEDITNAFGYYGDYAYNVDIVNMIPVSVEYLSTNINDKIEIAHKDATTYINIGDARDKITIGSDYNGVTLNSYNTTNTIITSGSNFIELNNSLINISSGADGVYINSPLAYINNQESAYTEIGTLNDSIAIGYGASTVNIGGDNHDHEIIDLQLNGSNININASTEFNVNSPNITIGGEYNGITIYDSDYDYKNILIGHNAGDLPTYIALYNDDTSSLTAKSDSVYINAPQFLEIGSGCNEVFNYFGATYVCIGDANGDEPINNLNVTSKYLHIKAIYGANEYTTSVLNVTPVSGSVSGGHHIYIGDTNTDGYTYIGNTRATTSAEVNERNVILCNTMIPNAVGTVQYIDLGSSATTTTRFSTGYFKNVNYTGTCAKSSDERLKNFGDNLKIDFDALAQIRKANYTWKDPVSYGEGNDIGVSAQEIQKLYPEVVVEDPKTKLLSVDYSKLSVVALAAIDELHKENVELKSRLDKLEEMIAKLTK